MTEKEFLNGIADIILSVFDRKTLTKAFVCKDGHFSPGALTRENLMHMKSDTLARLLLYLAMVLTPEEHRDLFCRLQRYIVTVR